MNLDAVLTLIDSIHPDDIPEDAMALFRLLVVVEELPKASLIRLIKRQLGEELLRTTDAPKAAIMNALGMRPVLIEKRRSQPALSTLCSFEGCPDAARAKGFCSGHYWQVKRGQNLRPLRPRKIGRRTAP